jgi:hypothetical protein
MQWDRIFDVYKKSRMSGVSFSLVYEEACDTWYFTIDSPAPSERYVGKSRSYMGAVDDVLAWLDKISDGSCNICQATKVKKLQAKAGNLINALIRYGQHDRDCSAHKYRILPDNIYFREPCTCGFDDVLSTSRETNV